MIEGGALALLLASLLGSPHCAAMCGPFVAFYAHAPGADRRPDAAAHVAYSAGRLTAYVTLGVVAGTLGAGLDTAGALGGIGRPAGIVAGVIMVAWGTSTLLALRGVRVGVLQAPRPLVRAVSAALARARPYPPAVRAAAIGMATALLPCGWMYVFVAAAGGTASPLRGAGLMALFWIGTLPVMVSLGVGLQRLSMRARQRLPAVTAAAVVVLGVITIAGRLQRSPAVSPHASHATPTVPR